MILNVIKYLIMNKKEISSDWIDRYNEGLLNSDELDQFQEQLKISPLLRAETRIDAELDIFLSDVNMIEFMDKVRDVVNRKKSPYNYRKALLIAASILSFLVISSLLHYFEANCDKEILLINPEASVLFSDESQKQFSPDFNRLSVHIAPMTPVSRRMLSKRQLLAHCYTPLPEYEILTGSVTRGYGLVVVSPSSGFKISRGSVVKFEWMELSIRPSVTIVIVNNKGHQVQEVPCINGTTYSLQTKGLPPGLYYWKILDHDTMVMIGKLIII